jgi:hypothetical protein
MTVIGFIFDFLFTVRYVLLALLVSVLSGLQLASYRRLSNFRGPFWASVSNLWMLKSVYLRKAHLDLYHAYQKYGLIRQLTPLAQRAKAMQVNLLALVPTFSLPVTLIYSNTWALPGQDIRGLSGTQDRSSRSVTIICSRRWTTIFIPRSERRWQWA